LSINIWNALTAKSSFSGSLSASFGFGLVPAATFPCVVELLSFGESFAESMRMYDDSLDDGSFPASGSVHVHCSAWF
jgi:hypothetical protein